MNDNRPFYDEDVPMCQDCGYVACSKKCHRVTNIVRIAQINDRLRERGSVVESELGMTYVVIDEPKDILDLTDYDWRIERTVKGLTQTTQWIKLDEHEDDLDDEYEFKDEEIEPEDE